MDKSPPQGIFLNRMSPSAHTRNHEGGIAFVKEYLYFLERFGRRVINGSRAFALEVSKARQCAELQAHGLLTPRTIAVVGKESLKAAARGIGLPFITKHNQGGKGLGVRLFNDLDSFDDYVEGRDFIPAPDGVTLLQQYIESPQPYITRVEIVGGKFLYAIKSSTAAGFELCPSDACQEGESGQEKGLFSLREDLDADDPLVRKYIAFCRENQIDVGGIEFIEGTDGLRYTYDINGTTNYNSEVETLHGYDGMGAIADFCAGLLADQAKIP